MLTYSVLNLIPIALFSFIILVMLFPFENFLNRFFGDFVNKKLLIVLSFALFMGFLMFVDSYMFLINFALILFSFWIFVSEFNLDRKYTYVSVVLLFGVSLLLFLGGLGLYAEYLSVLGYLLIIVGILKDLLYEKLFK